MDLLEAIMLVLTYVVYIVITVFFTKTMEEWLVRVEVYFQYTDPNKVLLVSCGAAKPPAACRGLKPDHPVLYLTLFCRVSFGGLRAPT